MEDTPHKASLDKFSPISEKNRFSKLDDIRFGRRVNTDEHIRNDETFGKGSRASSSKIISNKSVSTNTLSK